VDGAAGGAVVVPVDALAEAIARLPADASRHFGMSGLVCAIVETHDRPFSKVARVEVRRKGVSEPLGHVYAKVFKAGDAPAEQERMRRRVAHEVSTLQRIHAAMRHLPSCGVVPPVASYPDLLCTVTEEVTGPTLLAFLTQRAAWFPSQDTLRPAVDAVRTLGEWLRHLQAIDRTGGAGTIEALHEYMDIRLDRLVELDDRRFPPDWRERVHAHVDGLGARIPAQDLELVLTHSDLALGNVIVSGPRIVVLDFAMAKRGLRLHDLTRTHLQVTLLGVKPHFRTATLGTLTGALLEGFDQAVTTDTPLFRLLTLLHRINNLSALARRKARPHEALYNWQVRRHHQAWIASELARGADR
jgi:aminoglycoside phosphotransferase (APT) family kinase protein